MHAKPVSIFVVIAGLLAAAFSLASYRPAAANHTAVAIVAYPAESVGQTYSLVKLYAEPDDSSTLLSVVAPGKQIDILGLSENGAWIAIAKDNEARLAGWLATSEVRKNIIVGTTLTLVKVYRQPDTSSSLAEVIPPAAKVQVLGHNPDGSWIAIARPVTKGTSIRWVAASELKMPVGFLTPNSR